MSQLEALRAANVARQAEWCPDQVPDLSFRGNELAGEIGEACNVIKKLERERLGWRGSRDTVEHLAEELADGIICIDLVAERVGIDLWPAVEAMIDAPWSHRDDRCYRTLKNLRPDVAFEPYDTHHNALDDAFAQATHAERILGAMKGD